MARQNNDIHTDLSIYVSTFSRDIDEPRFNSQLDLRSIRAHDKHCAVSKPA